MVERAVAAVARRAEDRMVRSFMVARGRLYELCIRVKTRLLSCGRRESVRQTAHVERGIGRGIGRDAHNGAKRTSLSSHVILSHISSHPAPAFVSTQIKASLVGA